MLSTLKDFIQHLKYEMNEKKKNIRYKKLFTKTNIT